MPDPQKAGREGLAERVDLVASALGTSLGPEIGSRLTVWLDALMVWNQRLDLTAARSPDELVDLMVADAFVLGGAIAPGASVVDVGSGAGAPGLGLAILRPDLAVTLVEPLQKRVAFLRTTTGLASVDNVKVVRGRGEDLARAGGPRFDAAVARAVLAPDRWLELGSRMVTPEGGVWVLLARDAPPALAGHRITSDVAYQWPLTQVAHRAVRYQREPG